MLVDDSRSTLLQLKSMLQRSGKILPYAFNDAHVALTAAHDRRFDLVIVDHVMPKMDGVTFIQHLRLKPSYAQVPIVMLTGTTDRTIRLKALEAGAIDCFPKSSNQVELGAKLQNLITLSDAVRKRNDQAAWLADKVREATGKLQAREEEMIFRLSLAVEYRDNATGEHTLRVARYSRMIAEQLGLPPDECRSIYLAAPLHDIGKVAVPDHILLKPGRLTEDEIAVVRTHAAVGERILGDSSSDLMRLAAEIAGHHHERWDGSGYPRGISGEAIPLSARIVAVADVFDALTTRRPYKEAMSAPAALDCLALERGRHFDPRCLDAFVAAYGSLNPQDLADEPQRAANRWASAMQAMHAPKPFAPTAFGFPRTARSSPAPGVVASAIRSDIHIFSSEGHA